MAVCGWGREDDTERETHNHGGCDEGDNMTTSRRGFLKGILASAAALVLPRPEQKPKETEIVQIARDSPGIFDNWEMLIRAVKGDTSGPWRYDDEGMLHVRGRFVNCAVDISRMATDRSGAWKVFDGP